MNATVSRLPQRSMTTRAGRQLAFTGLGFGGAQVGNMGRILSEADAEDTIRAAWSRGLRYFDTAPLYGYGLSERRIGLALRGETRESFVLSSKVGLLVDAMAPSMADGGAFVDPPQGSSAYDYGYDAIVRSVEASLRRLGLGRIDMLLVHDIDAETHGSAALAEKHLRALTDGGGWRALDELRRDGTVQAIGAGLNDWRTCERLLGLLDPDVFLLAGRYTLLEQAPLDSLLPACVRRGVSVVVGGPFNSGVLAGGPAAGRTYDYGPAPHWVLERVAGLEQACRRFGVSLAEAALQFPLAHPAVVSVIPGSYTAAEVERNVEAITRPIPRAFWAALKEAGLLREDAPIGSDVGS